MLSNEIQPDVNLMVKILTACSNLGVLKQALCLHSYVIKCGFEYNPFVGASLIESYSKCGSLCNAIKVFDYMVKISKIKPNNVTFLSVLSACSHAGLIKEGVELFNTMLIEYQLTPESNHYAIMVDLFGRMGELDNAIGVINDMGVPAGPQIWGALLGACRIHHNTKLGDVAATNLFLFDSSQAGYLILLSNMHAANKD